MSKLPVIKALRAAVAASSAYGDESMRERVLQSNGGSFTTLSHPLEGASCTVFEGTYLILAFRGTQPTRLTEGTGASDILADISILPDSNGFHSGFSTYVEFLQEDLDSYIKPILRRNPSIPTIITGHSLGGAMAQIYAFQFFNRYRRLPTVFAFDSPACMSSNKAAQFNSTFRLSWRVYIHGDIVVKLLNAIYTHTRLMAEVYEDGRIEYEPSSVFETGLSHGSETIIEYLEKAARNSGILFSFFNYILNHVGWFYRR